ncbi:Helix-turn-helix [Bradyrhizobium sp. NFR13]|uniref:helix-turn-helix domain-containing protein n=1 Tax=Bradyrhizobium sp. NFR13 TaxID=1566285 RepID=UPI0008E9DB3C|nr:helix-turn-helix domain-containing protein [Bradyrhizobium sp. NFR13]SFL93484.1 Helix-turn-helix [Bradyrhizobium sp. NFR13]
MARHPNKIATVRKKRKLSQQQLAEKIGAHAITISNLERGQTPLSPEWLEKLAGALQVEESALMADEKPLRVFLGGEIWARKFTIYGFNEDYPVVIARTPPLRADTPIWATVRDDSLYPVFREFDIIRLIPILVDEIDEVQWAARRLCALVFNEGPKSSFGVDEVNLEIVVGYLQIGSIPGNISLDTIVGPPLTDIQPVAIFVIDRAIYGPDYPG